MTPSSDPTRDGARERALIKVQAASGALFALFLAVHLFNQMVAAAGPAAYDAVQGELRRVYQAPVLELVLVGLPLVVHVVASAWRMVRRRRAGRPAAPATRARLQRYTAIVLLVFVWGHIVATRGASLVFGVFPGFDAIAYTMVWVFGYFFPYYLVFSVAALYHLLNGLAMALPRVGLRGGPRSGRAIAVAWAAGAVALALGVSGFAGAFHDVRARAVAGDYAALVRGFSPGAP